MADRDSARPDELELTEIQSERLSALTGIDAGKLAGHTVAELRDRLEWQISPELLLFRRVCGRVVKHDPVSGNDYPVPNATVYVEDTDCGLLGYFPFGWTWSWHFPFWCRREVIGQVRTDACGNFCVWIPRFDIDWILRWRRQRVCFPIIFQRPSIKDLIDHLHLPPKERPKIPRPIPIPDPPPILKDRGFTLRRATEVLGPSRAGRLARQEAPAEVGATLEPLQRFTAGDAFPDGLRPPAPTEVLDVDGDRTVHDVARELGLREPDLERIDPKLTQHELFERAIGPFWRCWDVFLPTFMPILDVPDVTFRVEQDVDGDGDEETIYSEGFFDVRWDAGTIPNVTLQASQIAISTPACHVDPIPCEDVAVLHRVGLMRLSDPPTGDPYHDPVTGYARRPNRPHPSARFSQAPPLPLAQTPYMGTLQLYGCNHVTGADSYRLMYSRDGATAVPFLNLDWYMSPSSGTGPNLHVVPDPNGWYPILPDGVWEPDHLLLNWPTGAFQNGRYEVFVEMASGSPPSAISGADSGHVAFRIDNQTSTSPHAEFTGLAWRELPAGGWHTFSNLICPVVRRHPATAVQFRVSYEASADHMRSLTMSGAGCGGIASPARLAFPDWSSPPTPEVDGSGHFNSPYEHWHFSPTDNAVARTAVFDLAASAQSGAYSFSLDVHSRAFNPAGGDGGFGPADWNYDPIYVHSIATLPVAVVDL